MRRFALATTRLGAFSLGVLTMLGGCQRAPAELPSAGPIAERTSAPSASATTAPVCAAGQDQTCNENPAMSSLHGKCTANATCECIAPFTKASSGRCD